MKKKVTVRDIINRSPKKKALAKALAINATDYIKKSKRPRWKNRNQLAFTLSGMDKTLGSVPTPLVNSKEHGRLVDACLQIRWVVESLRVTTVMPK